MSHTKGCGQTGRPSTPSPRRLVTSMVLAAAGPMAWSAAAHAAELAPAKAAQATFAGASAWAVREDRNYAALAKAMVLHQLWDISATARAHPAAVAAAVQQKWDADGSMDDGLGRKLDRAVQAGAKSVGREGGAAVEKLKEKVVSRALPAVDATVLDKGGKAMQSKRGLVSAIDASLSLEDAFGKIAQRAGDKKFVQAYNETVGAGLGVHLGLPEAATRAQRPNYHAALEKSPPVVAMRNVKGGFSITAAQAVGGLQAHMAAVSGVASKIKADVKVLAPQQGNLLAYMADAPLRAAQRATLQQSAQVQQTKLDEARAASHLLKAALAAEKPALAQQVDTLARAHHRVAEAHVGYAKGVADLGKLPAAQAAGGGKMAATALTGHLLGATAELFSLYGNRQQPDTTIVGAMKSLGAEIRTVPVEWTQHFGRMDNALAGVHRDLGVELQKLELATADIQQRVGEIQRNLYAIEDRISSLERNLVDILQESSLQGFLVDQDTALGYKARTGLVMGLPTFDAYQVQFRSWADQMPCSTLFSAPAASGYADSALYAQLVERGYTADENFDFLIRYADARLGRPSAGEACAGSGRLANPKLWLLGAHAFVQLARENPWYAARTERNNPQAMVSVMATGTVLLDALKSLGTASASGGRRGIHVMSVDAYGASATALFSALAALPPGAQPSAALVQQVTGHKVLLQRLVAFGLPRALAENDYLNALLSGEQALPAGDEILRQLASGVTLASLMQTTESRRLALRSELLETFAMLDRGDYAETHSAIETMLAELENRRSVSPALAVGDFYTARAGTALNVPVGGVLANDARPFPADTTTSPVKARVGQLPSRGVLVWPTSRDGSFIYQAPAGFEGQVSFTYWATDGVMDSLEATVTIRVGPFGDLNGDGVIDALDLSLLMALIGKQVDDATLNIADLNGDGVVDALDARALTWICSRPACAR